MNQPSTQQASPAAAPAAPEANGNGIVHVPSLEERSNAAFEISKPSVDGDAPPADASAAGSETPDADKARAERRAAYAKLQEEERTRVDAQARHQEANELRRKLTEAEKQREEDAKRLVDPAKLDPQQFFDMAARLKVTPAELGAWLKSKQEDPAAFAVQAAQKAVDPQIAELKETIQRQQEQLNNFLASQQTAQEQHQAAFYSQQFEHFAQENAATSPLTSRLLAKIGSKAFAEVAQQTAMRVPPGAGAQAVLDEIEEDLAGLREVYAPQGAPQQRQAPTLQNPAAAKAPTTVSNTLAQTRASVVDEDADWASLPFEERSARLFR